MVTVQTGAMITEHAILSVLPSQESDFEASFTEARALISSQPGFEKLSLLRSIESPNVYVLLVEWADVESHTLGFRQSTEYEQWKQLLHHFYDPFPTVEHFTAVFSSYPGSS